VKDEIKRLKDVYADTETLYEAKIYALQQDNIKRNENYERMYNELMSSHQDSMEQQKNKFIDEIVDRGENYKKEKEETEKFYNSPDTIMQLYRTVRCKQDFIIDIKCIEVNKDKIKYNIMLIETKEGTVKVNVGRHFMSGEGDYLLKKGQVLNGKADNYSKIRELAN